MERNFRKVKDRTFHGDAIYRGLRYKLPVDKTIYQFLIDNKGLHKIIRNDDNPKLIKPVDGEVVEKYEAKLHNGEYLQELRDWQREAGCLPQHIEVGS